MTPLPPVIPPASAPVAAQVSPASDAYQAGAALGELLNSRIPHAGGPPSRAAQAAAAPALAQGYSAAAQMQQQAQQSSAQALAGRTAGRDFLEAGQSHVQGWLARLQQAASTAGDDPRALLNDTVDGMPVLPPGMTAQQASMYLSHDWPEHRERTAHVVVLISLNMPKSVISNLFNQVASDPVLRDETLFLMRGWANENLGFPKTVSELNALQPSGKYRISVAADPTWFEKLHVKDVPAVLVVNEPHMGMIEGDGLSIRDAVSRIRAQKDLNKVYGHVWRVTEPDPIKELKNKIAHTDWKKIEAGARDRMWDNVAKQSPGMPEAPSSRTTYFNPSVVATQTIRLPDGRVLVHKGDLINPLAQPLPWQTVRYITFNANRPWEIRQALAWSQQYPTAKVMMAAPPTTTQGWAQLEHAFGKPLYVLQPAVAQRLGLSALPSMTWPHGLVLQTYTQGLPRPRPASATPDARASGPTTATPQR